MISKEAIEAACAATVLGESEDGNPVNLEPREARIALEAALPFLPIAVEGKAKELDEAEGPFHVSQTSDGKDHWYSARDAASGVSIPGKSKENAEALVYSLNRAFDLHLRLASASSPGKDGGQEVEAVEWQGRYWIEDEGRWSNWITNPVGYPWAYDLQEGKSEIRYLYPQPASTALVERLTKALEPFAKAVEKADATAERMGFAPSFDAYSTGWTFTFGELREALAALSSSQSTSREGER